MSQIMSNSEVITAFIQTHPDVGLRMRTILAYPPFTHTYYM
jgi:hypothetical protein